MAANAATLQADARCIQQCVEPGFEVPILIYLFSQIAGVSPDPKTLMANARCLEACIPPGMMLSVLVSLASQILSGGGILPAGSIQIYVGRNPAPPDDPTKAALSYPSGGGTLTQWDVATQTWV